MASVVNQSTTLIFSNWFLAIYVGVSLCARGHGSKWNYKTSPQLWYSIPLFPYLALLSMRAALFVYFSTSSSPRSFQGSIPGNFLFEILDPVAATEKECSFTNAARTKNATIGVREKTRPLPLLISAWCVQQ